MSRPILDELTRALFAHLRGGNSCFDEENELIGLFRQCPRCSRSLRPLVLDSFTDERDGQQYERMWWTCPGIGQKQCFFPLDIPKEVFWTRRSMQQSLRGIFPLPNLHLLPRSLRVLYPKLFNRNINIEEIVRLSAFAPSDGQRKAERHANAGAEEQQQQLLPTHGGAQVGQSAGPSFLITLPPFPSSVRYRISIDTILTPPNSVQSQSPDFCDGFPSSSRDVERQQIERQQTVHSFLKETLNKRLPWRSQSSSTQRGEHRKTVDLSPNANAALNSHLLLNDKCDPKLMINSLNSLDPTARKQTSVPRYLSQQQHIRLKGMLRRSIAPNPKESGRRKSKGEVAQYNGPRYLFARTMPQEEETKKKAGQRQKGTAERSKTEKKTDGKGQRSDGMDVFTALDTLQKSLTAKEFSRFYGPHGSPSAIPSKQATFHQPTKSDRTTDSNELFHVTDSFLPQSLSVGPHSTVTPLTNSANSSESNGSSLGRFRRGLSIGPAVPGVSDNVGDPSLAEKITRNYESIFLKTLQQMNTNRRPVTPSSAFSTVQPHLPVSPQFGQIVPDEAVFPEESTLGGIPHDFHFSSAPQPVPLLPPAVRQSNQLMPINYAEGEDLSKRFAHKQMEVTEINQQEQVSSFSLGEMTDYDTYLGFGLEEEGDPAALEMTPMMPAGQVEDEGDFLRAQMGMLP